MAESSTDAARRLRVRIDEAVNRLTAFPLLGRIVPEFDDSTVRELIVGRYRLVYRINGNTITVVTVAHGSRDMNRHLPEGPWDIQ